MTSVFDKLNLRPQERRLVVIVGIVLFIVLNFLVVFPNFGALGKLQADTVLAREKLRIYQMEIKKQSTYQKEIATLQSQGAQVVTEAQALTLASDVNSQAALSGVTVTVMTPMQRGGGGGRTNAFFEEQTVALNVNTGEKELIDFLYRLADKELLIRAKNMQINPDVTRMRLQGQITLVKSFQRKQPAKSAATAPTSSLAKPPTSVTPAKTNAPEPKLQPAPPTPAKVTNAPTKTPAVPPAVLSPGGTNRFRRTAPSPLK